LGYLTLWPQGTTQPLAATLSALDQSVTSNLAIVPTTSASISAYAANPTQLIMDLFGYFAPSSQAPAIVSATTATFTQDLSESFAVTASGFPAANVIESGTLPTGVTFTSGQLIGTPLVSGTFPITFTAHNGVGADFVQHFTLTVLSIDLAITKTHNGTFTAGASGTYTIAVSNLGTGPTVGAIAVTDNLPVGLTYVSGIGTNWGCGASGQLVACTYTNPIGGGAAAADLTLTVTISASASGTISNTATVATADDNNASNNSSTDSVTVAAPSCVSNCSLAGTVTGPWVSGVTITITGGATATTNASGNYSFTGLAGGTYTITPSLAGYTYSPSAPSVTLSPATVQNFAATSATTSYSISGTVFYSGSKHGNTIIRVFQNCLGCGIVAGTSFSSAPSSTGTGYTIRGLSPTGTGIGAGSYVIQAEIDTLGNGIQNESNPAGTSGTVTIPSSNVTGVSITVSDRIPPSAPQTPSNNFNVAPGNNGGLVQYKALLDNNGEEIATSYKVYYGTDTNATNGAGSPITFAAQGKGTDIFILKNIANGLTYFKLSAVNPDGESAATTPVSVTLGAAAGPNSVSGMVTFPGTATGPLYAGLYGDNGIFIAAITNPTSPQSYTLLGVPAGTYQSVAILDMNNDGEVDAGDLDDVNGNTNPPTVTVSGTTTGANVTLSNATATTFVATNTQQFSGTTYNISVGVNVGTKVPISVTLFSGPNVAVPYDMTADDHNVKFNPIYNYLASPIVGQTYQFLVTFSDGTSSVIPAQVTAVLTSFAQNLAMQTTSPGSPTVPLLTWQAPASPPASYSYSVGLGSATGSPQENWYYSGGSNGNGIPSTQTSVLFNTDSSANPNSSLQAGTYQWWVTVQDNNNNTGQIITTYTAP
jgi:uncharacterized repeat protein (TIGR01451 family)